MGILPQYQGNPDSEQKCDFVRRVLIEFLKDIKNDKINVIVL